MHYHTVKKGESLSSIARKYNTNAKKLKKLNNLRSSVIQPKQRLVVKKIESKTSAKKNTAKKTSAATVASAENSAWGYETLYHTVKKGDNLTSISRKYNVSISGIKKANNLKNSTIVTGRRLKINVPRKMPDIETPDPIMTVMSDKVYYKIKKGDTIEKISGHYNISPEELKKANLLSDEDFKEGQVIVIPPVPIEESVLSETEIQQEADLRDSLIRDAFTYLNMPYRLGGSGTTSIDCTTLTKLVYRSIGISIPNTSAVQFKEGVPIDKNLMAKGDLVFFKRRGQVGHVGIYVGNDLFIHASNAEKKVTVASLDNSYFRRNFAGARRYLPEDKSLLARRFKDVIGE
jgi:cell wall-associated NlpC family hydrolase